MPTHRSSRILAVSVLVAGCAASTPPPASPTSPPPSSSASGTPASEPRGEATSTPPVHDDGLPELSLVASQRLPSEHAITVVTLERDDAIDSTGPARFVVRIVMEPTDGRRMSLEYPYRIELRAEGFEPAVIEQRRSDAATLTTERAEFVAELRGAEGARRITGTIRLAVDTDLECQPYRLDVDLSGEP